MKKLICSLILLKSFAMADEELVLNSNTFQPNYFSMFFGLLFVIALIYLTGFLYKKLIKIKLDDTMDEKYTIKVVSSGSLGPNKNLYVIKTDNKYSLIGATQSNISYIRDLGEDNEN